MNADIVAQMADEYNAAVAIRRAEEAERLAAALERDLTEARADNAAQALIIEHLRADVAGLVRTCERMGAALILFRDGFAGGINGHWLFRVPSDAARNACNVAALASLAQRRARR